jgi:hypothetical protein
VEVFLRRRSALVNGITAVLLIGITPPLPEAALRYFFVQIATNSAPVTWPSALDSGA